MPRAPANFSIITLEPIMSALLTYLQSSCRKTLFRKSFSGLAEEAHRSDAPLLQVAHLVAGHGRKVVTEERLEAHGRRGLLQPRGHRLEPALAFVRGVVNLQRLETRIGQQRLHGVRRSQMADGRLARPWYREQHLAAFAL